MILAHGLGEGAELPLPEWQLAWLVAFAVASVFVVLGAYGERPRLDAWARGRRLVPVAPSTVRVVLVVTRTLGVVWWGFILSTAWWGNENGFLNITGTWFSIGLWVALPLLSVVVGDVWRLVDPFRGLADAGAWVRARLTASPMSDPGAGRGSGAVAVGAIASFVWFVLAYHAADAPRSIAVYLTGYTAMMLLGAARNGRGWVTTADGFGTFFSVLATMGIIAHDRESDSLRLRPPIAGLARLPTRATIVGLLVVVGGATAFDGFTGGSVWADLAGDRIGWSRTLVASAGLVVAVTAFAAVYAVAMAAVAALVREPRRPVTVFHGALLVPVVASYLIGHYVGRLVHDGQAVIIHISDPYGRGADWFGTVDYSIDWELVSPSTLAWIQTAVLTLGGVAAVLVAHDRALVRHDPHRVVRAEYVLLLLVVAYAAAGVGLLLGG